MKRREIALENIKMIMARRGQEGLRDASKILIQHRISNKAFMEAVDRGLEINKKNKTSKFNKMAMFLLIIGYFCGLIYCKGIVDILTSSVRAETKVERIYKIVEGDVGRTVKAVREIIREAKQ